MTSQSDVSASLNFHRFPSNFKLKQIKVRSCEIAYGEDNVIEVRIVKDDNFLHMTETDCGTERENLDEPDEQDIRRNEADDEIARRLREGESYRSIQRELGVSPNAIAKVKRRIDSSLQS